MKRRYYLAYGSNLNVRQMKERCPMAKPMAAIMLENYELLFCGRHGSAVATVAPKIGKGVPCALWLVTARDETALDSYEGYPRLYRKERLQVRFGRRRMYVMAYIMNGDHPVALPGMGYLRTILDGYKDFGLDTATLDVALQLSLNASAPYLLL